MNKTCSRCKVSKPIAEFYGEKRSHCAECERKEARERMAQPINKIRTALRDSKKAARKVEAETGRKIKDDLTIYDVALTLGDSECIYCKNEIAEEYRTVEHLSPLRDGGANSFSNIRMACGSCNSVKRDLPLILHFIREQTDDKQALGIVAGVAQRERISFDEAFIKLTEQARTYFDNKAGEAIERAQKARQAQAEAGVERTS